MHSKQTMACPTWSPVDESKWGTVAPLEAFLVVQVICTSPYLCSCQRLETTCKTNGTVKNNAFTLPSTVFFESQEDIDIIYVFDSIKFSIKLISNSSEHTSDRNLRYIGYIDRRTRILHHLLGVSS